VTCEAPPLVVDISFGEIPASVVRVVVYKSGETSADEVVGIKGHNVCSWVSACSQYAHRQLSPLISKNSLAANLRTMVITWCREIDHYGLH
jgi:hypothetical protein